MAASPSAEVQEELSVSSTTTADTESTPVDLASEASQPVISEPTPESRPWLALEDDPSSWYSALRAKAEEDARFHNVVTSLAGRSRQSQEVAKVQAKLAEAERQRDLAIIAAQEAHLARLEPAQQTEFLAKNPEIALRLREKEKLSQPIQPPNPYEQEIQETYVSLIEDMRLNGLPENWIAELHNRASSGAYAAGPDGQRTPLQQLRLIEKDRDRFVAEWQKVRASLRPAPVAPAAAAVATPSTANMPVNTRLQPGGPDVSSRGSSLPPNGTFTQAQVDAMNPNEFAKVFGLGGYSQAVRDGRIRQ